MTFPRGLLLLFLLVGVLTIPILFLDSQRSLLLTRGFTEAPFEGPADISLESNVPAQHSDNNNYQIINNSNDTGQKYLTITTTVGGLGDRLRGVVTAYYLAFLLGRKLLIGEQVFGAGNMIPALADLNWTFPNATSLVAGTKSLKRIEEYRSEYKIQMGSFARLRFEELQNPEVVDLKSNLNLVSWIRSSQLFRNNPRLPELKKLDNEGNIWTNVLTSLFKPGPRVVPLLEKVEAELLREGTFKIGLHIRTDDTGIPLVKNPRTNHLRARMMTPQVVRCFAEIALSKWRQIPESIQETVYPLGLVVFISTDKERNQKIVEETLTAANVTFFDGQRYTLHPVHHLETSGVDQTRTFFDWWVMSKMNLLIASQSGFSSSASRLHCVPFIIQKKLGLRFHCGGFREYQQGGLCRQVSNFSTFLL